MNDSDSLYDLVKRAQSGDQQALYEIIKKFDSSIRKAKKQTKRQDREDLEQVLMEKLIRAILAYDLNNVPDVSKLFNEFEVQCKKWVQGK
jgi:DNA-directed RNA polymerase specialized sigma subunit